MQPIWSHHIWRHLQDCRDNRVLMWDRVYDCTLASTASDEPVCDQARRAAKACQGGS